EQYRYDYDAILWLRQNVRTPETIVEAGIGPYRGNGGRISMFTGLPAVVGWDNHEAQQRYPDPVHERNDAVRVLYDTSDPRAALEIISRYGIRYIYVGPVERLHELESEGQVEPYASRAGLAKFERMAGSTLDVVYRNSGVTIYRVRPSWRWPAAALDTRGSTGG
ncbi:MAG: hypothetical protein M3281_07565, partial [Chloroflexota bacterium]|nr:hypothetical protein [Chloroflexota bacterium]